MVWEVKILSGAIKQLEKLPLADYKGIKKKIIELSDNPRPRGCEKLKSRPGYRIRYGKYRIIYTISDNILTIIVVRIGHRKDIYR
jgi:mRNA interferase RelE/StbE